MDSTQQHPQPGRQRQQDKKQQWQHHHHHQQQRRSVVVIPTITPPTNTATDGTTTTSAATIIPLVRNPYATTTRLYRQQQQQQEEQQPSPKRQRPRQQRRLVQTTLFKPPRSNNNNDTIGKPAASSSSFGNNNTTKMTTAPCGRLTTPNSRHRQQHPQQQQHEPSAVVVAGLFATTRGRVAVSPMIRIAQETVETENNGTNNNNNGESGSNAEEFGNFPIGEDDLDQIDALVASHHHRHGDPSTPKRTQATETTDWTTTPSSSPRGTNRNTTTAQSTGDNDNAQFNTPRQHQQQLHPRTAVTPRPRDEEESAWTQMQPKKLDWTMLSSPGVSSSTTAARSTIVGTHMDDSQEQFTTPRQQRQQRQQQRQQRQQQPCIAITPPTAIVPRIITQEEEEKDEEDQGYTLGEDLFFDAVDDLSQLVVVRQEQQQVNYNNESNTIHNNNNNKISGFSQTSGQQTTSAKKNRHHDDDHIDDFLIQFELERYKITVSRGFQSELIKARSRLEACRLIRETAGQRPGSRLAYDRVLERETECEQGSAPPGVSDAQHKGNSPLSNGSNISSSGLFYRATLQKDGTLELDPPEVAHDRRIYRMFGSDRFLEVQVKCGGGGSGGGDDGGGGGSCIEKDVVHKFFGKRQQFCGRLYDYFWCKKEKNPQRYILFAERGVGIAPEKECTAFQARDRCIPRVLNPDMALGEFAKRLKLLFSQTTPTAVLPPGSVEVLPEFGIANFVEIDGCGLVSRPALDMIWAEHQKHAGGSCTGLGSHENTDCPYTGFQGRLGGFKGTWILDDGLGDDVVVQCRESQLKFKTWQRCLKGYNNQHKGAFEDFFDTMEVNSWDKRGSAFLNTRIIQILESFGVELDFFQQCVEPLMCELEDLAAGGQKAWLNFVKSRQAFINANKCDDRVVFKMAAAEVGLSDREFARRRARLLNRLFEDVRDKARYPLKNAATVRLYADHTLLLEEGEAFLAVDGAEKAREVLAIRMPSYFAGDLRRLRLVDLSTLIKRSTESSQFLLPDALRREPTQKLEFFWNARNALILCNKGERSEADRMSGGDYDGDNAIVCWNADLLGYLPEKIIEVDAFAKPDKCDREKTPVWGATRRDELDLMFHYRRHGMILGELAEVLDLNVDLRGFDDPRSRELGRAAFLQVDMPYHASQPRDGVDTWRIQQEINFKWPNWKYNRPKTYASPTVLGNMHAWITKRMDQAVVGMEWWKLQELDSRIQDILRRLDDSSQVTEMRRMMQEATKRYIIANTVERRKLLKTNRWIRSKKGQLLKDSDEERVQDQAAFFKWKTEYCCARRKELIENWDNPMLDRTTMAAALLYEACFHAEIQDGNSYAMEFAWDVAEQELFRIFCAGDCLVIQGQMEKELFGGTFERKKLRR